MAAACLGGSFRRALNMSDRSATDPGSGGCVGRPSRFITWPTSRIREYRWYEIAVLIAILCTHASAGPAPRHLGQFRYAFSKPPCVQPPAAAAYPTTPQRG